MAPGKKPAFYATNCPVFSIAWLSGGGAAGSHVLYSGGGGSAKTGVFNKISINQVSGNGDGGLPALQEVCSIGTGDDICAALDVDKPRTEAKVQLVAGGIGSALLLYGVTGDKKLVRLTVKGVTAFDPTDAASDGKNAPAATEKDDLRCVAIDRSDGATVATGDGAGVIRIYRLENVDEVAAALAAHSKKEEEKKSASAAAAAAAATAAAAAAAAAASGGGEKTEAEGDAAAGEVQKKVAEGGDVAGDGAGKEGEGAAEEGQQQEEKEEEGKGEKKKKKKKAAPPPPPEAPLLAAASLRLSKTVATLKGHTADVTSLRFDSTGRRLCSSSKDGTARVWSVASGKELCVLPTTSGLPPVFNKHKRPQRQMCRACEFSPSDDNLVYTLQNASVGSSYVSMWALKGSVDKKKKKKKKKTEKAGGEQGGGDGKGQRAEGAEEEEEEEDEDEDEGLSCEPLRVAVVCKSPVPCMALSPDGGRLVTGDTEGGVTVSDATTLKKLKAYAAHQLPCTCLSVAPAADAFAGGGGAANGDLLDAYDVITGSGDKTLILASSQSGSALPGPVVLAALLLAIFLVTFLFLNLLLLLAPQS